MSLQAWYPFNGNLENLGLGDLDLTVQTSPKYTTGKVTGQALDIGNFYWTPEQSASVLNNQALSFSFWLKPTASTQPSQGIFVQQPSVSGRRFCIFTYPTLNDLHLDWRSSNGTVLFNETVWNGFFPINTWTHCAITYEYPNVVKIYRNGSLYKALTPKATLDITDFKYQSILCGGIANRYINDFRVYNHCLSPKEVKEISKGLMLHYPLNNNGMGCKNYIKNSFNIKPSICNHSSGTFSMTAVELDDDKFKGTFYKVSRSSTGGGDFRIGWTDQRISIKPDEYNDKKVTFSVWVKSSTGTTFGVNLGRYSDLDISAVGSFVIKANEWTKISCSKTFLSTSANASAEALELYFHLTANTDVIMAQAKLEVSDYPTPWCPNEADELYSQLGMDENIEYDTSGYRNNGKIEKNSAPEAAGASARGKVCYHFKDLQRLELSNIAYENMSKGTVSFWIKFNEKFLNWSHYLKIANGFNWTGKDSDFIIVANNATVSSATTSTPINIATCSYITAFTASVNTWYHIAIEWDAENYVIKKYLNGSLLATHDDSSYKRLNTYRDNHNHHHIGNVNLNSAYSGDFNFSDFRIYATCLSDSDIQELYNKPISIDNQGTMFSVEAVEEIASPVKFNKTGVVEANQIGEYFHNYFTYDGPMYTGINNKVKIEKLIENNGLKLTCNSAVTTHTILHRMQSLMFNGASGDFKMEFDGWATNPVDIRFDVCDKTVATYGFNSTKQHFSGVAYSVNQYNTNSAYNGFFDIEASSIPLGTEIYITNIVITKNTPKSVGSNYIVIDDIIEN